jgi:O-antigen/teichoic acid export membrane protein
VALTLRGGIGKLVMLASMAVLSKLLLPADFGVFAIIQLPIGWLNLIADAGIGSAMIQAQNLTPIMERTGFVLRLMLAAVLGLLLVLGVGVVDLIFQLPAESEHALRLLAFGPAISALGTVPSVKLSRTLRFERLALAEMGSLLAGQGAAIALAWYGAGLWSLVAGSLITIATGSLLVNSLSPWRIRMGLVPEAARMMLRFGVPFQAQGLIHLAKDQAIITLGGLAFSNTQVGYLTWAKDLARWPRSPADYVARVAFPAFSRLQDDPAELSKLLQGALTIVCLVSFTAVALGIALGPLLVTQIFGTAWAPAVPVLIFFLAQTPLDVLAAILLPLIYASGQAWLGLRLSIAWAAFTWLFGLIVLLGWPDWRFLPLAVGAATGVAVLLITRRLPTSVHVRWQTAVGLPLILASAVGGLSLLLSRAWIQG